jgi:sarcosine oxidase subunit beta
VSAIDADVAVLGGGIAGASAAFHLAARQRRVMLLERGEIAAGASGVNAGAIESIGWGHAPDLQAHLTAGSLELFEQLARDGGFDIELRQSGGLQAIQTPEQYDFARDRVRALAARGHDIELLTAREAMRIEPALSPSLLGATYSRRRANADPVLATRGFAALAARTGARILTGHEVTAIQPHRDGWTVCAAELEIVAPSVVIAAGAWSGALGALLGLDIPIVPVRGQMWATAPLPPRVFQTVSAYESPLAWARERAAAPVRGEAGAHGAAAVVAEPPDLTHRGDARVTRHLYGRQRKNGEVIFGGDRQLAGWSTTPAPDGIAINRGHAAEILPFLRDVPTARTWAGLMPFTLDGAPLIGRVPARVGVWIVSGLASSGFGRGPMAGKLLADALVTGAPAPVLATADPARCVREAVGSR